MSLDPDARTRHGMNLVHLTSSTFFGGPERQMLGLAEHLPESVRTSFVSFAEGGRCDAFLDVVRCHGFEATALRSDFPKLRATVRELSEQLHGCDLLLCHGYKANVLGRIAARRIGVRCVAVSRGWTGENRKVKAYEWLDRRHLRFMDRVVCVSDGQAEKVRRWCGVPESRLRVIRNSARLSAFEHRDPNAKEKLEGLLSSPPPSWGRSPRHRGCDVAAGGGAFGETPDASHAGLHVITPHPPCASLDATHMATSPTRGEVLNSRIVLAAGRLSPEKGFQTLVEAAAQVPGVRFVLFGEGTLRPELERRVKELGLADRFVMPGFRTDLDSLTAAADVVVLPSFTEGLPNVALEASAAGVPVVATAVGGTPEVIADGETGFLVPPGRPDAIAAKLNRLLNDADLRSRLGRAGRERMIERFTFDAQADAYLKLFEELVPRPKPVPIAA